MASLWSGTWFASQLPLNQIEATASNLRKIRYVIELQCLALAANGMTSSDIGIKLGITERTANFHFRNIIGKLGVLNRQEAIAVGIARGIVRRDPAMLPKEIASASMADRALRNARSAQRSRGL